MKKFILPFLLFSSLSQADDFVIPNHKDLSKVRLSSVECLAVNLYHESRSESDIANLNVLSVVLNRVKDKRYPNDICKVIFQRKQYSWTGDGLSDEIKDTGQYRRLYKITEEFLMNREFMLKHSEGVTHYHTNNIRPYWTKDKRMKFIGVVDNHTFYKWIK